MTFQPSSYSYGAMDPSAIAGIAQASAALIGGITTTAIQTSYARKSQASAQKQERKMAKEQAKLYALEAKAALAQTEAGRAAAMVQAAASRPALYAAGAVIILGMTITLGVVLLKSPKAK